MNLPKKPTPQSTLLFQAVLDRNLSQFQSLALEKNNIHRIHKVGVYHFTLLSMCAEYNWMDGYHWLMTFEPDINASIKTASPLSYFIRGGWLKEAELLLANPSLKNSTIVAVLSAEIGNYVINREFKKEKLLCQYLRNHEGKPEHWAVIWANVIKDQYYHQYGDNENLHPIFEEKRISFMKMPFSIQDLAIKRLFKEHLDNPDMYTHSDQFHAIMNNFIQQGMSVSLLEPYLDQDPSWKSEVEQLILKKNTPSPSQQFRNRRL